MQHSHFTLQPSAADEGGMIVTIFHVNRHGAHVMDTMPFTQAVTRMRSLRGEATVRDTSTRRLVGERFPLAHGKYGWWIDEGGIDESDAEHADG